MILIHFNMCYKSFLDLKWFESVRLFLMHDCDGRGRRFPTLFDSWKDVFKSLRRRFMLSISDIFRIKFGRNLTDVVTNLWEFQRLGDNGWCRTPIIQWNLYRTIFLEDHSIFFSQVHQSFQLESYLTCRVGFCLYSMASAIVVVLF